MKKNYFKNFDFILLFFTLSLLAIGLITVYSATNGAGIKNQPYFSKQIVFAVLGIITMLVIAFMPFKLLVRTSFPLYGLSIFLLILVLFFGVKGYGAERWLALGSLKIQPSELAKLATILAVGRYLSAENTDINQFKHFMITGLIILLPFALIVGQPDLGTSLVFLALLIPLLFWAGLNWFYLFVILSPALTALLSFNFYAFLIWMGVVFAVLYFSKRKIIILASVFILHIAVGLATPAMWNHLRPYQQQRILTFTAPEKDPHGAGYQIIQSKVAIGSGGLWGKGFMHGSQTQLKFLPAQHTDFIFSVLGEERGFFGVSVTLGLFLLLLLYMLYLATNVNSVYGGIVISGITTLLLFHVFVNVGMTVGLAPVTGLPLPFISYGGSFLLVSLSMIGYALNLAKNRFEY